MYIYIYIHDIRSLKKLLDLLNHVISRVYDVEFPKLEPSPNLAGKTNIVSQPDSPKILYLQQLYNYMCTSIYLTYGFIYICIYINKYSVYIYISLVEK